MRFFDISDTISINLDNIDVVEIQESENGIIILIVTSGREYEVDQDKHKEFFELIKNIQKAEGLGSQYTAL